MCQLPKEGMPSLNHCQCNPFFFSDLCALAQAVDGSRERVPGV